MGFVKGSITLVFDVKGGKSSQWIPEKVWTLMVKGPTTTGTFRGSSLWSECVYGTMDRTLVKGFNTLPTVSELNKADRKQWHVGTLTELILNGEDMP